MQGPIYRLRLTPQDPQVLQRRLDKALKSQARALYLSYREAAEAGLETLLARVLAVHPWKVLLAVNPQELSSALLDKVKAAKQRLVLEYQFCDSTFLQAIEQIHRSGVDYALLLRPRNLDLCRRSLHRLPPREFPFLYFEFANFDSKDSNSLSVRDISLFMKKLSRELPNLQVRPYPGLEFFHSGIPEDFELEATEKEVFTFRTLPSEPLISVIIPTYNGKHFLGNALRHLLEQDFPREHFEIIVVDDGSNDDSANYIFSLFQRYQGRCNMQYLYWPRNQPRMRGEKFFRAGLARNLGVRHARSQFLSFLDADMIVDKNYVERKIELLKNHDLIQSVRHHLRCEQSSAATKYENITDQKQTYIEDSSYWRPFFVCPQWSSLPFFWKYTCTYSLSLKKEDFYQLGRFYRNFIYYGFEDTHLGYRFAKAGKKFHLDPVPALHLTSYSQSEYRNSKFLRMNLLDKTAKTLFLNTLDLELHDHFSTLLGGEKSLFFRLRRIVQKPENRRAEN